MIVSIISVALPMLLMKSTAGEESSYLANVLTNIQRERLGLLDEEHGSPGVNRENDDNPYINEADDILGTVFLDNRHADVNTYTSSMMTDDQLASLYAEQSSQPSNDLIYIYNDTIYLYKAPNVSDHSSVSHPGSSETHHHNSLLYKGKPSLAVLPLAEHGDTNAFDDTDPENLINIVVSGTGGGLEESESVKQDNSEVNGGYHYYYYPLDKVPPELANSVANILLNPKKPVAIQLKPGKMPGMPMKPLMPVKSVMMKKPKQPVGPLFKAMAVFVGTAVVFIASILLLPRVKLVKAKALSFDIDELTLRTIAQDSLPWNFPKK